MPARRANLHEPVETENPEVTGSIPDDNPEVVPDEPDEAAPEPADEADESSQDDDTADESEAVTDEPEGWYPGQTCLNCGARAYKWTTGWGTGCSACAPENQVEED